MRKKTPDFMETKKHVTTKPVGQQVNQRKIKKYLKTSDDEGTTSQIYGMLQKQCSEGNS